MPDLTAPRGNLARRLLAFLAVLASGLDPGARQALRGVWRLWRGIDAARPDPGGERVAIPRALDAVPLPCELARNASADGRGVAYGKGCAPFYGLGGHGLAPGHGSAWSARQGGAQRLAPLCPNMSDSSGLARVARGGRAQVRGHAGVRAHV